MKVAWGSAVRLAQILWVFLRHGLAHLLGARAASWPWLKRRLPMAGQPAPERLRRLFEDMGGTFIKFGQMLALQPDILDVEYCNALFNLLDRVEPFDYSEVERILVEELGKKPEELFESFSIEPLATASVGQVHVAWLGGRKVAVKVQRPNVEAEFQSDIRLMMAGMRLIEGLRIRGLNWLLEPMGEFVGWTSEELDYRNEANYSEQLRRLSADSSEQYVPQVVLEYTTRRTLVVEFLDGVTLLDYLRSREQGDEVLQRRLEARGFDRKRFAANVIDNFLGDAFRHGIYHADLHPANLMILENSVVGYIDFGITGVMSPYSRHNLMAMTLGLARGDMDLLYAQFLKLSAFDDGSDLDGFRSDLDALAAQWYERDGDHRRLAVNFTQVMTDMLHVSRNRGVMPERDIIKYIRSAIAIDGLIIRFEMDFHVGAHLEQSCARHLKWQNLRRAMSQDSVLSWSSTCRQLLVDGPARSSALLDRLASGDLAVKAEMQQGGGEQAATRGRALQLAAMILTLTLLTIFTSAPVVLGFNLFTATMLLIAVGFGRLLPAVWRLA